MVKMVTELKWVYEKVSPALAAFLKLEVFDLCKTRRASLSEVSAAH